MVKGLVCRYRFSRPLGALLGALPDVLSIETHEFSDVTTMQTARNGLMIHETARRKTIGLLDSMMLEHVPIQHSTTMPRLHPYASFWFPAGLDLRVSSMALSSTSPQAGTRDGYSR